jgi:hypothetical protein
VGTPSSSGSAAGRWADCEGGRTLGGNRMAKKRMPAAERHRESGT